MKKRNILIGILIILFALAIGLTIFVLTNSKEEEPTKNPTKEEDNNQVVDLNDDEKLRFDTLAKYGKEIYAKEDYKKFEQNELGVYYMTINDLSEMGYDMSLFGDECDKLAARIYFDIEHKMVNNYSEEPLLYVVNCENKAIDKTP